MSNVKSVMIVGVGGQGTLLASRVLGSAMLSQGVDVKVSEVHGMSQRGGSVVTYVRYGDKVYSPIIAQGEADVLLAFEALEAARYLPWLKPEGTVVVNPADGPDARCNGRGRIPEGHTRKGARAGRKGRCAGRFGDGGRGRLIQGGQCGFDRRHGQETGSPQGGLDQYHQGDGAVQIYRYEPQSV